jgi:Fic family protein
MRNASPKLWMMLGEAISKTFHIAGVPLMPDVAEEFSKLYLTKGAMATAAIEGNTLTEEEVRRRMDGDLDLPPSREYLGKEIDNILSECNRVAQEVYDGTHSKISVEEIKRFNKGIMNGLEMEDGAPGVIRHRGVGVGRYSGAPPEDCEYLLGKMVAMLNSPSFEAKEGDEMLYGILKAIVAHIYFVWIHPFFDGNGRTARLIELKFLLQSGIPFPACHLLSNHYNLTRDKYYKELDRTSKGDFDILPFIEYSVSGFVDGLKEQLKKIRIIQWELCWVNFIHEKFKDQNTEAQTRRRHLILDLSKDSRVEIPIKEIRMLTTRLVEHYSGKGFRTISRDLNQLVEMNLILKDSKHVVVLRQQIVAFLPVSAVGIMRLF